MTTPDESSSTGEQSGASTQTATTGKQADQSGSENSAITANKATGKQAQTSKPDAKQASKPATEPNKIPVETPKAAAKKGPEAKHEVLLNGKSYGSGDNLPADISETDLKVLQAVGAI